MKLQQKLKQIQHKIDLVKLYKLVESWSKFPIHFPDEIDEKVAKEVVDALVIFAKEKIREIESEEDMLGEEGVVGDEKIRFYDFSSREIFCLKKLAEKLVGLSSEDDTKKGGAVEEKKKKRGRPKKDGKKDGKKDEIDNSRFKGLTVKLISLSNLNPSVAERPVCAYDLCKVIGVNHDILTIQHQSTGDVFDVPVEDVE